MNLGFNEPWTGDVFVLGFNKPVELHRGIPRTDLGLCEHVKLAKGEPLENWPSVRLGFWQDSPRTDLGLMSLVCVARMSCSCIHIARGVACTGVIVSCSCIHVTRRVARIGVVVACSCTRVTREVACTGDLVLLYTWLLWSGTRTRDMVFLHTCHLWASTYCRLSALAYMALV